MEQVKSLYKIMAERNEKKAKYFSDYLKYAKIIGRKVRKLLKDAKVIVFGSVVRGDYSTGSDIDILVISRYVPHTIREQSRLKLKVLEDFDTHPFEIHFATPDMYENWFKNFIKNDYIFVIPAKA